MGLGGGVVKVYHFADALTGGGVDSLFCSFHPNWLTHQPCPQNYNLVFLVVRLSSYSTFLKTPISHFQVLFSYKLREAFKKKYYLDREIVPIPSDTPTIETVSEYLDSEYW